MGPFAATRERIWGREGAGEATGVGSEGPSQSEGDPATGPKREVESGQHLGIRHTLQNADDTPPRVRHIVQAFDVTLELPVARAMVLAIVFEQHLVPGENKIPAHPFPAGANGDLYIRLGFGETGTHDEQSQEGLPAGLDSWPHPAERLTQCAGPAAPGVSGYRSLEVMDRGERQGEPQQPIARSDQVIQAEQRSQLAPGLHWVKRLEAVDDFDARSSVHGVAAHATRAR